ncbi:C-type lectin BPL-like isoform X3 [Hypanus sabinus]|uniref:C-type lectin BPL-like isoform X3 n=1 Tax=Hypanus sabinus TaxID=79690 RepID=UPI0028C3DDD7|nr:C-type lectin BPL-like isoform X3 [Hypanus sabinus]
MISLITVLLSIDAAATVSIHNIASQLNEKQVPSRRPQLPDNKAQVKLRPRASPFRDETEKANSSENKTPKKSSHDAQIFQTPCLVGWVYNRDLSTCYRYYHTKKNWIQAEIYCQKYAPGGHLASIHWEEHNQFIQDLIKRNNPAQTSTWIGLSDCHKEGVYLWTDGSATDFTKWKHDQPEGKEERENCVITNSEGIGGTWDDRVCSDELPFVCGYKFL